MLAWLSLRPSSHPHVTLSCTSPHELALNVFPSHRIRLELLLEPCLLCTRRLEYDSWTSMLPDKSTPPQAETDLPLGRARIPANWSLQLNIRNFLVVDDDGNILQEISRLREVDILCESNLQY